MITYHDGKQTNQSTSNYYQVKQACRCHTEIYIFWKEYSFECMFSSYSTFLEIHMHASEEKVLCYKAYSRCHCPCHWHVREEKKNTCITGGYELKMILFVLDCDFGLRYLDHNLGVSKRHQSGTPNTVVNATASLLYSMNISNSKHHKNQNSQSWYHQNSAPILGNMCESTTTPKWLSCKHWLSLEAFVGVVQVKCHYPCPIKWLLKSLEVILKHTGALLHSRSVSSSNALYIERLYSFPNRLNVGETKFDEIFAFVCLRDRGNVGEKQQLLFWTQLH